MSDKEGKYWKGRLESITNEYKKWREISRKQIKSSKDQDSTKTSSPTTTQTPIVLTTTTNNINTASANASLFHLATTPNHLSSNLTTSSENYMINNSMNSSLTIIVSPDQLPTSSSLSQDESRKRAPQMSNQLDSSIATPNLLNQQPQILMNENVLSSNNNSNYTTTSYNSNLMDVYNPATTEFYDQNNQQQQQQIFYNNSGGSGFTPNNNLGMQPGHSQFSDTSYNSYNQYGGMSNYNTTTFNNSSTQQSSSSSSKQAPYNNRYPSPSPGLFQDFDLYNFSSDTLFSTYLAEDPKDTIFGTNPDLFQPDLMHFYPNFDFFDLADASDLKDPSPPSSATPKLVNATSKNDSFKMNNESTTKKSTINNNNNKGKTMNRVVVVDGVSSVTTTQAQPSNTNNTTTTSTASQQNVPVEYIDLSNFNTLVTVAAAQSSSHDLVPVNSNTSTTTSTITNTSNTSPSSKLKIEDNTSININNNASSSLQMPASLSQINNSLLNRSKSNPNNSNSNNVQIIHHQPVSYPNNLYTENTSSSSSSSVGSKTGAVGAINNNNNNNNNTIRNLLALNTPIHLNVQENVNSMNANVLSNSNSSSHNKKLAASSKNLSRFTFLPRLHL